MILLYYELSLRAGAVVQLGERFPCTEEVAGSNPVSSTILTMYGNKIDVMEKKTME